MYFRFLELFWLDTDTRVAIHSTGFGAPTNGAIRNSNQQ